MSTLLASISETLTLLLNTPIVPPQLGENGADVPLTDLPHRRRGGIDRARSGSSLEEAFGEEEAFVLERTSEESTRTTTEDRTSSELSGVRDDVPAGPELSHNTQLRSPQLSTAS
ncbi:hypothetical protein BV22DRAFT_1033503 [Leucogyrophana mollusca]|uniref:Uncharacterized protein n=1 Tax=Leucogyrophana mollusca TaxID=85980 RepID=A0ACB8BMW0_9AGAM|nr:hypothetical protein BV22DRAFT_1033503 [Leucogyrophana mollusca]